MSNRLLNGTDYGAYNLSLFSAGVAASAGFANAVGLVVGGQHPISNNFYVEGVDTAEFGYAEQSHHDPGRTRSCRAGIQSLLRRRVYQSDLHRATGRLVLVQRSRGAGYPALQRRIPGHRELYLEP